MATFDTRPPADFEGGIWDPPGFDSCIAILQSPRFWKLHILPRLPSSVDKEKARSSYSVLRGDAHRDGHLLKLQFRFSIRSGGEALFDALHSGFAAYMSTPASHLLEIESQKPNKAPEPTTTSVMPAAEQPSRRP